MGFSNTLKSNAVNEWKDYYLDYDKLRAKVKNPDFRAVLYNEVIKINNFYFLLERKAVDEKNTLFSDIMAEFPGETGRELRVQSGNTDVEAEPTKTRGVSELEEIDDHDLNTVGGNNTNVNESTGNENKSMMQSEGLASFIPLKKGYARRKKEKHITEFLHSLVKIKAYRDLNATGLLKLAKKYASFNENQAFYAKFNDRLRETYFYKSKRIDSIRNAVKKMYKQIFAKGQPEKAKTVFRRLGRGGSKTLDVFYMLSGLLIGSASTVIMWSYGDLSKEYSIMTAVNNILLGFVFFGLCLKTFKNFSINYKFIFNFDVVSSMNNSIYFLIISTLMFLNSTLFLLLPEIKEYSTYMQLVIPIVFLFNPFDCVFFNSRIYLVTVYARGFFLPLSTIRFRHFYFIDILQSFRYSLTTIIEYFISDESAGRQYSILIFSIFPFLRGLQCMRRYHSSKLFFPHVANAAKYTLVFACCLLEAIDANQDHASPSHSMYGLKYVPRFAMTLASFLWDTFIDWAILRNRYMFPPVFYLIAILINFLIRFMWVFRILLGLLVGTDSMGDHPALLSVFEIVRRSIWTLIRVEVEHLNNCDELKFKKTINLTGGELFYKKDIDENYQTVLDGIMSETEFETEMEDKSEGKEEVAPTYDKLSASEDDSHVEYEDGGSSEQRESTDSHEHSE